jgi:hypothetical protein
MNWFEIAILYIFPVLRSSLAQSGIIYCRLFMVYISALCKNIMDYKIKQIE